MQRFCFSLDLYDDPHSIDQYVELHRAVWPAVLASLRETGVQQMEMYRLGARLFMIMDTDDAFSPERKLAADLANPRVQEWETLMERFQKVPEGVASHKKWQPMEQIFDLRQQAARNDGKPTESAALRTGAEG